MHTLTEIGEAQYQTLVGQSSAMVSAIGAPPDVEDQTEFVLERYLEDFIVAG